MPPDGDNVAAKSAGRGLRQKLFHLLRSRTVLPVNSTQAAEMLFRAASRSHVSIKVIQRNTYHIAPGVNFSTGNSMVDHNVQHNQRDGYQASKSQGFTQGPGAVVTGNKFQQLWQTAPTNDLSALMSQLFRLQDHLKSRATDSAEYHAIAEISSARAAAAAQDGPKTMEHLSQAATHAGKWLLDQAREIGVDVAAAAISHSMGVSA